MFEILIYNISAKKGAKNSPTLFIYALKKTNCINETCKTTDNKECVCTKELYCHLLSIQVT